jgi:hypothetical protein
MCLVQVWFYMVYDARDRLIMTQDEDLRANYKWLCTVYDDLNRSIKTELLTDNNASHDRAWYQLQATGKTDYPDAYFSSFEVLTESYYDNYNWIANTGVNLKTKLITTNISTTNYFYTVNSTTSAATPYPVAIKANYQDRNMVTGTKTEVLGTVDYLYAVNFYDDRGRLIQIQSHNYSNPNNATTRDTVTMQYSFSGQVLRVLVAHKKAGTNPQNYRVSTKNEYDDAGRLTKISKLTGKLVGLQFINSAEATIAQNKYNELGQLQEKDLGLQRNSLTDNSYTSTPVDVLNYEYNIRGWLRGINKDYARNGSTSAWFGMELCYDFGFTSQQFNGNIAGERWRSRGDGQQRAYGFTYDNVNRLTTGDFTQRSGSTWDNSKLDFTVSNLTDDLNGNILSMNQMGMQANNPVLLDQLAYGYFPVSNQLKYVNDQGPGWNSTQGDFKEINNNSSNDYTYDANGNLLTDNNKNITGITYNYLNLLSKITIPDKGDITYTYDAAGNKLNKIVLDKTVTPNTTITTDYIGPFTYQADALQFIATEEGRARPAAQDDVMYYDYFEKDHLGNVRVVLTDEKAQNIYPAATLEGNINQDGSPNAIYKEKDYYTVNSSVVNSPSGMPAYQNNANGIQNNNLNSVGTDNSQKVCKLTATSSTVATGLNITVKVMSGDFIDIFGKSYWTQGNTSGGNVNLPLADIIAGMLGAPKGIAASHAASFTGLTSGANATTIPSSFLTRNIQNGDTKPMAYINYILFDEQFQYVAGGFSRVGGHGDLTDHHTDLQNISVTKNGYLYVYCSNQSPVNVFFDNLQIVQTRSSLIEVIRQPIVAA